MASPQAPRLYHSAALLLPDGRVLTTGGDDITQVELYSPPYLFAGARPSITAVPAAVSFGQSFFVQTPDAANIAKVTWIRLGSVTHAFDMNQRINSLSFSQAPGGLNVVAPSNPNLAPPGHYLLFILNANGVPSIAKIVQLGGSAAPSPALPDAIVTSLSYASGVFTSTVKNQGTAATPAGVDIGVAYSVDGVFRTWGGVSVPLAARASDTIGTNGGSYIIPNGAHTITAFVDDENRFAESDETNNQLSQPITVGAALPDVIVTSLSYAGGIFTSTVKNQGTAATPAGVDIGVAYSVDGVYGTWGSVSGPLAAGASVTIGTNGGPYIILNGTHTITAYVDDVNRFAESDETNNQLSQPITVP